MLKIGLINVWPKSLGIPSFQCMYKDFEIDSLESRGHQPLSVP